METIMKDDKYIDHPTHETYLSDCSECYKENRIIKAKQTVNRDRLYADGYNRNTLSRGDGLISPNPLG